MIFVFTKDYITQTKNIKKGTVCLVLDDVVVVDTYGKFLFDVDSGLARKLGEIRN